MDILRKTNPDSIPAAIARLIAAGPQLGIGLQHVLGTAPLLPIIQGTPMPLPELNAAVGPWVQVISGVLLLVGFFARFGGLMSAGAMAAALFTHLTFEAYTPAGASEPFTWVDEPPIALPIVVLVASLVTVFGGAGKFSADAKNAEA